MAAVAGAVTVAACAAAAALALAPPSSCHEARDGSGGATVGMGTAAAAAAPRECAVCLSELVAGAGTSSGGAEPAVRTLPGCGHGFHAECIGRWLQLRPECPLCRRPVALADGRQAAVAASATAAPAWARPARIACGFGDGRVVWTRSPSSRQ